MKGSIIPNNVWPGPSRAIYIRKISMYQRSLENRLTFEFPLEYELLFCLKLEKSVSMASIWIIFSLLT